MLSESSQEISVNENFPFLELESVFHEADRKLSTRLTEL